MNDHDSIPGESEDLAQTQEAAPVPSKPVERLFPFVLKTRGLVIGREALRANKGKLHFVLIATDIAETGREEVLKDFIHYPVVQHFTAAELQAFFHFKDAKAVGFLKSGLAQSIYAELKAHRINRPFVPKKEPVPAPVHPNSRRAG